ncbi:hypothetical protein Pcinc_040928 [Petrolisthes cinctipes]|uniref:Cytochrome b5 heme-binding domain-containing protein n=1 Tax=Petrolisthes cinctipes TaxID=88211 RepID=A0AAE1EKB4_PETCI|nr:hypothetical protein Pcinc_040928 [Petrolisthes cinctipes]
MHTDPQKTHTEKRFLHYPTLRDHPLKSAHTWIQGKRIDDDVGDYWRVYNKLYDLTHFADIHPGGKDWIRSTRGTDITELFECYHISDTPQTLLKRYYVKDITTPRNSPYTFNNDGFYKTFKRKVKPILKEIGRGPTHTMLLLQDGLALTYVLLTLAATLTESYTIAVLAGLVLSLTMIGAHNFFHQRDNLRMYYFDLSLLSSYDWRITHGISHHIYPNTIYDFEVSVLEPGRQEGPGSGRGMGEVQARGFFARVSVGVDGVVYVVYIDGGEVVGYNTHEL